MKAYTSFSTLVTPQSQPIPGEAQVANNAGGYVYALDKWQAFERFLILGTEGGTYYVGEQKLTKDAALNVMACIAEDGVRAVDLIVAVSDGTRAPKNDPAEFALALAASATSAETRAYALAQLPKVCRIPTHLFHFIAFVKQFRGMGRGLRRAIGAWYDRFDVNALAYELVKYQGRDGWSNRDVLRVTHAELAPDKQAALRWAIGAVDGLREVQPKQGTTLPVRRYRPVGARPAIIDAFEEAKTASTARLVQLIADHGMTREMVPTEALTKADVWAALLQKMPMTALLRNLGNLSKCGLLTPLSDASRLVVEKLSQVDAYRKKRVHPVAVLVALKVYASGHGVKGDGTWTPVPAVTDALDAGLYHAFGAIEPTGQRILYGLDISGSMSGPVAKLPLTCAEGAAVMALVSAKAESAYYIHGFADEFRDLGITPRMRLDDVLARTTFQTFGGTDCSLPMVWAKQHRIPVDVFEVITDNETWAGAIHPSQALRAYRQSMGINAKLVVVGMTATNFTIADPADPRTLDVVGFDTATPQAISEFARN